MNQPLGSASQVAPFGAELVKNHGKYICKMCFSRGVFWVELGVKINANSNSNQVQIKVLFRVWVGLCGGGAKPTKVIKIM